MSSLIVISHYNAWPTDQLVALLDQIATVPAGASFDVCVVVNQAVPQLLSLPERHAGVRISYRENTGYNVGAWEFGWRQNPAYACYLFLQEECRIVRAGWLQAFRRLAMRPGIGLVGESLNWAGLSWNRLTRQYRGFSFWASVDGEPMEIVAAIRTGLRGLNTAEGQTGAHLQSLIICARREVLEAVGGFPTGLKYDDATIAEIALSKKVEAIGLKVREVGPGSFRYILHPQWKRRQGVIRSYARIVAARVPVRVKEWLKPTA